MVLLLPTRLVRAATEARVRRRVRVAEVDVGIAARPA
jgi:hypothetical protein